MARLRRISVLPLFLPILAIGLLALFLVLLALFVALALLAISLVVTTFKEIDFLTAEVSISVPIQESQVGPMLECVFQFIAFIRVQIAISVGIKMDEHFFAVVETDVAEIACLGGNQQHR